MDPAEVRRATCSRRSTRSRSRTKGGAIYDTGDYADGARPGARRRRLRRRCAPSRPPAASAATPSSSASACRVYVEITGGGGGSGRGERHGRGAPGRHGHRAHRHVAARPGPRDGLGDARQRAARASRSRRSPSGTATPTSIPRGARHDGLAQPAARRRRRAPGGGRAGRAGQAAGRGRAGGRPVDDLVVDRAAPVVGARRTGRRGHARPSSPRRSRCGRRRTFDCRRPDVPVRRARGRRRGRRRDRQGGSSTGSSPSTTPGTILNPLLAEGQRHGGIAQGVAQALLEEVVYDADGNPLTATLADYPFLSATELPSFELVDMETPTHLQPAGRQGHRRGGHDRLDPGRAERRRSTRVAHLGVRHIDMPATPAAGVGGDPGRQRRAGSASMQVEITVNGAPRTRRRRAAAAARALPARRRAACTATNVGCDTTSCGACTVLARRRVGEVVHGARRAGRRPRGHHASRGCSPPTDELHPMQAAFRAGPRAAVRLLHARAW